MSQEDSPTHSLHLIITIPTKRNKILQYSSTIPRDRRLVASFHVLNASKLPIRRFAVGVFTMAMASLEKSFTNAPTWLGSRICAEVPEARIAEKTAHSKQSSSMKFATELRFVVTSISKRSRQEICDASSQF